MVTNYSDSTDPGLLAGLKKAGDLLDLLTGGKPTREEVEAELSSYWRENRSSAEATELANLLRALQKVAGHLGPNVGRVEYLGMSDGTEAGIVLDPSMVMGDYPVSPEKVDHLVGIVVHDGLHRIEWSERVWKSLEPEFKAMTGIRRVIFQKLIHTAEDIYIDGIADKSVLGRYTHKAREQALAEAWSRLRLGVVSVDALLTYWWAATWRHDTDGILLPAYMGPLLTLTDLTAELESIRENERGVTRRCEKRADAYLAAYRAVEDTIGSWNVQDKRLHWYITPEGLGRRKKAAGRGVKSPDMAPALVHGIESELAATSTDITPIIKNVAGVDNPDVARMSRWDFHMQAHPVIDRRLVGRIRAIFANYAQREKVVNRGLLGGRVDGRRLYRAPVSGRCFHSVDRLPKNDWCVCLLMDASGSMRGPKWRMVENTVGNIHRALQGDGNMLQAYAYFEMDGVCMFSRLIEGRKLMSVPPSGQTASGQAIIAAAHFMPRDRTRKLLIHVTDGESNFGVDVEHGMRYCRSLGVNLVTLGCGCREKEAMEAQYGRCVQFLGNYGQLPQAVERLLKWSFLYGHRKNLSGEGYLKKAMAEVAKDCA
ncbi:MAG: vWA domain-containing protein [Desulfatibacillaceae bacterium]